MHACVCLYVSGICKELNKAHHLDDLEFKIRMVYDKIAGSDQGEEREDAASAIITRNQMREGLLQVCPHQGSSQSFAESEKILHHRFLPQNSWAQFRSA